MSYNCLKYICDFGVSLKSADNYIIPENWTKSVIIFELICKVFDILISKLDTDNYNW